ncbi:TIGR03752 family integrating conjugative element protein [Salinisphaera hydrothermalis]|uniref:Integrating conjugative element protein n=1 Tax=Salinisphaera hydrothermalis (strain C41B8) TaxID=1304275 RepID=A0A084IJ04_SALHC|nr:TIGR03752 family integrating conjugative element protein [Salinisphaera hydrothermalis]KEZ76688.1 hypothetical protein C41B8_13775 [Salinisphaera hydrothermalis C41B8]
MQIKSNALLKVGVPLLIAGVIVFVLRSCHNSQNGAGHGTAGQNNTPRQLTDSERKALGVEADNPNDTVSTLVAKMQHMQSQLKASQEQSEKLREQNQQLAEQKRHVEGQIEHALSQQNDQAQEQRQSLIDSVQQKIANLRVTLDSETSGDQSQNNPDMPVGLGLNGETPESATGSTTWVNPLEARSAGGNGDNEPSTPGGGAFKTAFDSGKQAVANARNSADQALPGDDRTAHPGTPVYTVPKSSTLMGSVAMTALLGRVPINGTVTDPYPFKVIIGGKNLTANGNELPEIKKAIVSGTATGDWTLSCVRGKVKSITFVFQDGRIRTVPESARPGEGNDNDDNEIGYLSNPAGVPCVAGTRKTNARSFILTSLLLSAGAAAGNAYAGGETETSVSGLGTATGVTGDVGKYIAGSAASSGLNEVRQWIQQRFGQTFDAVYVPPGHPVAVNIDKEIPIDYEHNGRKVRYAHDTRANGLD